MLYPNIGWIFLNQNAVGNDARNMDKKLASHCKNYGDLGFSFITYPIGGILRYFWQPDKNQRIPPIHLPGYSRF